MNKITKKAVAIALSCAMVLSSIALSPQKRVNAAVNWTSYLSQYSVCFYDYYGNQTQELKITKSAINGTTLNIAWQPAKWDFRGKFVYDYTFDENGNDIDLSCFKDSWRSVTTNQYYVGIFEWNGNSLNVVGKKKVTATQCSLANLKPGRAYHIAVVGKNRFVAEEDWDGLFSSDEFDVIIPYKKMKSGNISVEYQKQNNQFKGMVKIKSATQNYGQTYLTQYVDYKVGKKTSVATKGSLTEKKAGCYTTPFKGNINSSATRSLSVNVANAKTYTIANIRPVTKLEYTAHIEPARSRYESLVVAFQWDLSAMKENQKKFVVTKRSTPLISYGSGVSVYVPHPIKASGKGKLKLKVPTTSMYEAYTASILKKKVTSLKINKKSKFTIKDAKKEKMYTSKKLVIAKDGTKRTVVVLPLIKQKVLKDVVKKQKSEVALKAMRVKCYFK